MDTVEIPQDGVQRSALLLMGLNPLVLPQLS
jgi:hypothetical protein